MPKTYPRSTPNEQSASAARTPYRLDSDIREESGSKKVKSEEPEAAIIDDYLAAIQAAAHSTLRANEAFSRASSERIVVVRELDQLLFELGSLLEMAAHRGAR